MVYEKNVAIQDATNSIATLNHQVDADGRAHHRNQSGRRDQRATGRFAKGGNLKLQFANENLTNEIAQYKNAVDTLEAKLKEAYAGIEQQNETITNLVAQRDDFVKKYNDEVKDRNDVVAKYNDLAKQVQQPQSGSTTKP